MPIKALMVDVDGVVATSPAPHGWSTHLQRDLGLAPGTPWCGPPNNPSKH